MQGAGTPLLRLLEGKRPAGRPAGQPGAVEKIGLKITSIHLPKFFTPPRPVLDRNGPSPGSDSAQPGGVGGPLKPLVLALLWLISSSSFGEEKLTCATIRAVLSDCESGRPQEIIKGYPRVSKIIGLIGTYTSQGVQGSNPVHPVIHFYTESQLASFASYVGEHPQVVCDGDGGKTDMDLRTCVKDRAQDDSHVDDRARKFWAIVRPPAAPATPTDDAPVPSGQAAMR
jgi:hypothetical protein